MAWLTAAIKFLAPLLKLVGSIVDYYSRKQLIDAGKAEERLDAIEEEEANELKVDNVIKDIDNLQPDDVVVRMSKYKRSE